MDTNRNEGTTDRHDGPVETPGGPETAGIAEDAAQTPTDSVRRVDTDAGAPPASGTAYVYVSGDQVVIFTLNMATGGLIRRTTIPDHLSYVAFAPGRKHLYAATPSAVRSFTINQLTGALTSIPGGDAPGGGTVGTHIGVHPSGKWVLIPFFGTHDLSVLPVGPSGGVKVPVDRQKTATQPHQVVTDSTGRFVFVPCREGNEVTQFLLDEATGKLTPNDPPSVKALAPKAMPRHMAFHPTEKWAYVINELGGTTTSYKYDRTKGTLSEPETVRNTPAGFNEYQSAHILVHPTGRYVYGSNRIHNSIVIFSVDQTTGRLTLVGHEQAGGAIRTPRDFTIDPTGSFLLVANQATGTLIVFRINAADGKLARLGEPTAGPADAQFVGVLSLP